MNSTPIYSGDTKSLKSSITHEMESYLDTYLDTLKQGIRENYGAVLVGGKAVQRQKHYKKDK